MSTSLPVRVLFVCLGNICRSPMAEAVFRHKVKAAELSDKIEIDSAGTGSWHTGEPPHHGTRKILDKYKVSYAGQTARQLTVPDLERYDYIVTMDNANLRDVRALGPSHGKVVPLLEYATHISTTEVPDPYYSGGFEGVYQLVDAGCEGLLEAIRKEHSL